MPTSHNPTGRWFRDFVPGMAGLPDKYRHVAMQSSNEAVQNCELLKLVAECAVTRQTLKLNHETKTK